MVYSWNGANSRVAMEARRTEPRKRIQVPERFEQTDVNPRYTKRIEDDGDLSRGIEAAIAIGMIEGPEEYAKSVQLHGGKPFLERVHLYGRDPRGNPLVLRRWFLEILEALGDWRISIIVSTGCSRAGKTLGNTLASIDMLTVGMLEAAMFYPDRESRDAFAPGDWRPLAKQWVKAMEEESGLILADSKEIRSTKQWVFGGVPFHFRYASTSKDAAATGNKPAIGAAGAGFQANALFEDERSQWPLGVDFSARLNRGIFPVKPRRLIGTPGGGNGIELYARDTDHYFMPHCHCDACNTDVSLDPYGCLLTGRKEVVNSREVDRFVGHNNRPLIGSDGNGLWWFDPEAPDQVEGAMVCCSNCGEEIPMKARTVDAWMQCTKTGVTLRDYLDNIEPYSEDIRSIALHFSPLVRENFKNIAPMLVRDGFDEGRKAADWVQQDLGHPTYPAGDRITEEIIKERIGEFVPWSTEKAFTAAGVDAGRGQHWLWVVDVYFPPNWRQLHYTEIYRKSIRALRFAGDFKGPDIDHLLDEYEVDCGFIDNEPFTGEAASICKRTVLEMADQKGSKTQDMRERESLIGGVSHRCFFINSQQHLQGLVDCITGTNELAAYDGMSSYRFPETWSSFLGLKSDNSPIRHLTAIAFDPIENKWIRPTDSIDDIAFAGHFAEAAILREIRRHAGGLYDSID